MPWYTLPLPVQAITDFTWWCTIYSIYIILQLHFSWFSKSRNFTLPVACCERFTTLEQAKHARTYAARKSRKTNRGNSEWMSRSVLHILKERFEPPAGEASKVAERLGIPPVALVMLLPCCKGISHKEELRGTSFLLWKKSFFGCPQVYISSDLRKRMMSLICALKWAQNNLDWLHTKSFEPGIIVGNWEKVLRIAYHKRGHAIGCLQKFFLPSF